MVILEHEMTMQVEEGMHVLRGRQLGSIILLATETTNGKILVAF